MASTIVASPPLDNSRNVMAVMTLCHSLSRVDAEWGFVSKQRGASCRSNVGLRVEATHFVMATVRVEQVAIRHEPGMDHSIAELEARLGIRLLERTIGESALTDGPQHGCESDYAAGRRGLEAQRRQRHMM
jgi:hypothetical protein